MSTIRVRREEFVVPLCTTACPAGVDVPRYIRAVKDGQYDQAMSVLREKLPLPTVCADACFAPCEDVCAYRQFGDPIAIRAIKRAAVDRGGDAWRKRKRSPQKTGKSVAIVGAGPAGLTAAYYLGSKGHDVTLFDPFPKPGGTLRYGIPRYRLPEERLEKDIQVILETGVTFRGGCLVGKEIGLASLRKDHDAVFIASGANSSTRIPLEGSGKKGVFWGLEFLLDVSLGRKIELGKNVVVVGGGNVAIDVALTAKRLGGKNVQMFCLESREEMPAHPWEIALAEEEGVFIHNSWAPKRVLGADRVTGLGFMRCSSVFDGACNFNPVYDEEITHRLEADSIILAVGQRPSLAFQDGETGLRVDKDRVVVRKEDLSADGNGIFAGGDVVTGPASIISAIAQGRAAAEVIDRFLGGSGDIAETLAEPEEALTLPEFRIDVKPRTDMARLKTWERAAGFDQVELGLGEAQAGAEASRCLNCDARKFEVVLMTEYCKECGYCAEVCKVGTFVPASGFNAKGHKPMEVKTSDHCVGCLKCFFACPDFAIDVRGK